MNKENYLNTVGEFGEIALILQDEGYAQKDIVAFCVIFDKYLKAVDQRPTVEEIEIMTKDSYFSFCVDLFRRFKIDVMQQGVHINFKKCFTHIRIVKKLENQKMNKENYIGYIKASDYLSALHLFCRIDTVLEEMNKENYLNTEGYAQKDIISLCIIFDKYLNAVDQRQVVEEIKTMNKEDYLSVVDLFCTIALLLQDRGYATKDTNKLSKMFCTYLMEVDKRLELERLKK